MKRIDCGYYIFYRSKVYFVKKKVFKTTKIESFVPFYGNLSGDKLTAIVIRKVLLNITKDDLLLLFNSLY